MQRRRFITVVGGAALAWPFGVRAQQPTPPVIGFVNAASRQGYARPLSAFLKGLSEAGYVDGRNVAIEYRWAEDDGSRLPGLIAELVQRRVSALVATTTQAALAAKAATTTIPIVFETASDPIRLASSPALAIRAAMSRASLKPTWK
jgi:putative ABC transport system substrate-binding protein